MHTASPAPAGSPIADFPLTDSPPSAAALLALRGVSLRFGGIKALDAVSFEVASGTVCGLIGPNGAGKTSLFNCLSRLYPCTEGQIDFRGQALNHLASHEIAPLGIGRTFQNLALFKTLSVLDNVRLGRHCRTRSGVLANALRLPRVRAEEAETARRVLALIDFLDLRTVMDLRVAELPFGTQKRVELARALAAEPLLLLLDEPACGLNHEEVMALADTIRRIRDGLGVTVLLVEHHMGLVMGVSDHVVALNFGRVIAQGLPRAVATHPEVVNAYLGGASA